MPDGRLVVWDIRGLHVFSPAGDYLATWPLPLQPQHPFSTVGNGTADTSGYLYSIVSIDSPFFPDSVLQDGSRLQTLISVRSRADGRVLDTLMKLHSPRPRMLQQTWKIEGFARPVTTIVFQSIPLVPYPVTVFTRNGHWVYAKTERYSFISIPRPPNKAVRVESDLPAVVPSREEREFYRAEIERSGRRIEAGTTVPLSDIPEVKPHIKALKSDRDARIWVELYQPAQKTVVDTTTKWIEKVVFDVFEATGEFAGRVRLPDGATFATAMGNQLWLVQHDTFDVPTLVRYSMHPQLPAARRE
jgi:hypothetical protein